MSIRDSVCVLGGALTGVLLGFGISYEKMLRLQSAHLKQLPEIQATIKQLEEKLEDHIEHEKTDTKQLQNKLEEIQSHLSELDKAETDDKKALERKLEEIQTFLKREEANKVEFNTSLKPFENQLKFLVVKCDRLEHMNDEINTTLVKIDRRTETMKQIRLKSSTNEESRDEGQQDLEEDRPKDVKCQLDLEEDRHKDIFRFDILILHANKDQREANECKRFLMHNFPDICNLQVALPEDLLAPGTQLLPGLSTLLDSCRLVFIYVTENLESDPVAGYGKQVNFIQSLKDPLKEDRIIPLQLNEENISVDLCTVQPLEYVKDTTDRQFPDFKLQFENLVKFWKTKLP
ncbi:uncharacterized protein LOC127724240 isoform X3 [Mytilus californianus]|uniref:uncharacterized protein LOC127724240 isoform X3 n=1 Tax=Mytilus californianus TaxID=6549 RepID=UPI00224556BA|nr:uncharacterized protein LOC127724240 isoform X3 [Mytilus californianus]XP_052087129.1 uncharacterized protein LOC127724240 isoform X3 [Mytilus californianus]